MTSMSEVERVPYITLIFSFLHRLSIIFKLSCCLVHFKNINITSCDKKQVDIMTWLLQTFKEITLLGLIVYPFWPWECCSILQNELMSGESGSPSPHNLNGCRCRFVKPLRYRMWFRAVGVDELAGPSRMSNSRTDSWGCLVFAFWAALILRSN